MTPDLRRKAVDALIWAYATSAARLAVQFLSAVILARLLGPQPFGLAAAAWVLVGVASQFVDLGFGSALVQRNDLDARQIRFAFTLQVIAGIVLTALMMFASRPLAAWLGNPAIAGVVAVLSPALLIQALGQTAASLLRRSLDLRTLQLAQLTGVVLGFGAIALPMAVLGYGVESLVAGQLAQSLVTTLITYTKVRHPVRPLLTREFGGLLRFGVKATSTNLVNWLIAGIDSLAVTRYFGAITTGWFNRAQALALVPGTQLAQILQGVLFPAYSRRVEDRGMLRQVYLASLACISMVLFPAGVVLAVTAETVVRALYGAAWMPAAGLLVPLALAMPVHGVMALNGPLLWASDRVADELRVQCGVAVLFLAVLFTTGRWTATAMCWGILFVYAVRCGAMMRRTLTSCGARWRDCGRAACGPALLAVFSGLLAVTADSIAGRWNAAPRMALVIAATSLPAMSAAALCSRWLLPADTRDFLRSCCAQLPLPVAFQAWFGNPPGKRAWGGAL